ncbi:hypothetical protein [Streptomyces sp. NPDC054783]
MCWPRHTLSYAASSMARRSRTASSRHHRVPDGGRHRRHRVAGRTRPGIRRRVPDPQDGRHGGEDGLARGSVFLRAAAPRRVGRPGPGEPRPKPVALGVDE